ncbi:PREDICTED: uncharacterized protein LOC109173953 [Ipomoea nil]|uniref:uncharacterized protein LOC109173953 n=1 Tax=Ipomoea nil TaxID=35883 RepID=UPI000901A208|nr:PREDICTED: uncharacterized protein LOC109173953 [Ipomoea nil]
MDKIKCLLCKKVMSGGVYRIKEHIAGITGNVSKCPIVSKEDQLKCRDTLMMAKNNKKNKRAEEVNMRAEVNIGSHESLSNTPTNTIDVDELQDMQQFGHLKPPRPIGPMDKFANQINPESSLSSGKGTAQQRIIEAFDKERGIEQVGEENVVQIVTDNAVNNMGAAKLLKEKRPRLFWTCCATHSINLMLESIPCLPRFKKVLDQAKSLTIFIYAHHKTLSISSKKIELKAMFSSNEWDEFKGKAAYSTVTNASFWQRVILCLNVFATLVKVLRIVDQDKRPSMGFVYGELMQVKEDIKKAFNAVERNYELIIKIVEEKMSNRLDSPLHLMAFMLNPYYHFKDPQLHLDVIVSLG